jgi:hypothetical protein
VVVGHINRDGPRDQAEAARSPSFRGSAAAGGHCVIRNGITVCMKL